MRISDWSSDVCSSDLIAHAGFGHPAAAGEAQAANPTDYLISQNYWTGRGHRQVVATGRRPPQWTSWTNNQAKLICNSRPLQGLLPALPASSSRSNTPLAGGPDMKTVVIGGSGLIGTRSEEHTSELQSLMRISYAVFCLKKKTN